MNLALAEPCWHLDSTLLSDFSMIPYLDWYFAGLPFCPKCVLHLKLPVYNLPSPKGGEVNKPCSILRFDTFFRPLPATGQ